MFKETCLAIQYIHNKNIMHWDLKPENILLNSENVVKLSDFGWSAVFNEEEYRETVCGTFEYMAPEIFEKKDKQRKQTFGRSEYYSTS